MTLMPQGVKGLHRTIAAEIESRDGFNLPQKAAEPSKTTPDAFYCKSPRFGQVKNKKKNFTKRTCFFFEKI